LNAREIQSLDIVVGERAPQRRFEPIRFLAKNVAKSLTIFLDHLEFDIGAVESAERWELFPEQMRGAIELRRAHVIAAFGKNEARVAMTSEQTAAKS
jgi:hypothetical protein